MLAALAGAPRAVGARRVAEIRAWGARARRRAGARATRTRSCCTTRSSPTPTAAYRCSSPPSWRCCGARGSRWSPCCTSSSTLASRWPAGQGVGAHPAGAADRRDAQLCGRAAHHRLPRADGWPVAAAGCRGGRPRSPRSSPTCPPRRWSGPSHRSHAAGARAVRLLLRGGRALAGARRDRAARKARGGAAARAARGAGTPLAGGRDLAAGGAGAWARARAEFSDTLPAQDLSDALAACDLLLFADTAGPSSRKGTLAASLASGRPVLAIDGPRRWLELVWAEAASVVEPTAPALADAMEELLGDRAAREALGARGRAFAESGWAWRARWRL